MLETLQQIENLASQLRVWSLAAVGAFIVFSGLIIWLAGLRQSRLIGAMAGAIAGLAAGLAFVKAKGPAAIAIATTLGALLGLLLDKFVIIIAGALLVVVAGLLIATSGQIDVPRDQSNTHASNDDIGGFKQMLSTAAKITGAYTSQACDAIKGAPVMAIVTSAIAGLVVLGVGFFWPRLVAAAVCASLGTALIFAGMITVLIFKGSEPVARIGQQPNLYALAAGCMVVFGTTMQMMLCPAKRKEKVENENTDGEE